MNGSRAGAPPIASGALDRRAAPRYTHIMKSKRRPRPDLGRGNVPPPPKVHKPKTVYDRKQEKERRRKESEQETDPD